MSLYIELDALMCVVVSTENQALRGIGNRKCITLQPWYCTNRGYYNRVHLYLLVHLTMLNCSKIMDDNRRKQPQSAFRLQRRLDDSALTGRQ